LLTSGEDACIFGPFGGEATVGAAKWAQRSAVAVRNFKNGQSELRLIQHYTSGDLLVLVLLEEQTSDIAGHAAHPWSLRVTQVYRREDGAWKLVHRHADPLTRFRSVEQTLALAADPK
jgi:ketosteroid isomerase-like protein